VLDVDVLVDGVEVAVDVRRDACEVVAAPVECVVAADDLVDVVLRVVAFTALAAAVTCAA
jgi:hypothetical protein